MGTSANAGWRPSRYNATHDSVPQTTRYGQNDRTSSARMAPAMPSATSITPSPPPCTAATGYCGAMMNIPARFVAIASSSTNGSAPLRGRIVLST